MAPRAAARASLTGPPLSDATQLPLDFGSGRPSVIRSEVDTHFRSLASTSLADRRRVAEAADHTWDLVRLAPTQVSPVVGDFSVVREGLSAARKEPYAAADWLREHLGLAPLEPAPNLIQAAEGMGIIVGYLPDLGREVSAYSCWFEDSPMMLVRAMAKGRRRVRFDTAHEIAHILMHRGALPGKHAESEANAFAGSLLLPREALAGRIGSPLEWNDVFELVERYDVTVPALLRRAREMALIGPMVYRSAMAHISRQGGRRHDPRDVRPTERASAVVLLAERYLGSERERSDPLAVCARHISKATRIGL